MADSPRGIALPDGVTVPGDVSLAFVPWDDADAARLRDEQQTELAARYGGVGDLEPVLPPDEMLATVLVRVGGVAAGCGSLRAAPGEGDLYGELKRMFVHPGFRRRGLSRAILSSLEPVAVGLGLRRLILETGTQQPEAIGLYRSAGYRRIANYGMYAAEPTSVCYARWLDPSLVTHVLVVNGTVGAGKSAVSGVATDLLEERGVPHVRVDVDALAWAWPRDADDPYSSELAFDCLTAIAPLHAARGLRHVLLPRVVEDPADRERYERAFDGADVRIVRVDTPEATRIARLHARSSHAQASAETLARSVELAAILEAAGVDDAVVLNDRAVRDVAADLLHAAGW